MQKNYRSLLLGLICSLTVAACDSGSDGSGETAQLPVVPVTYAVGPSAVQVVGPLAAPTSVTAVADIFSARDTVNTLNGSVMVNGAVATSVSLNIGYPGENGPVEYPLDNDGGDTWSMPEDTVLDEAEYQFLNGSGYYVSIQTPQGELRGQVLFPGWIAATVVVEDQQVVPTTVSSGSATAGFLLNPDIGFVRLRMTTDAINDATSASLRGAITGARGDVVVAMEASSTDPAVWGTADINDPAFEEFLTAEAAGFVVTGSSYFSLETVGNPGGELRGQLVPLNIDVVDVTLTDEEVVTVGPPVVSSAQGIASVTWNSAFLQFSVAVNTDVTDAVSVSVYQGAAGEIGPVVLDLMPDVMLPGNWLAQRAELTNSQATALINDGLYVGIVTAANPEGELRGQILLDPPAPTP